MRRGRPLAMAALVGVACAPNATRGAAEAGPAGTLVVANMGDNTATVIDVATRRTLATLPTAAGPHEVAVSHDGRWAVVSGYGIRGAPGNTLTVIDLAAPVPVVARTINLGAYRRPHGSAFLPGDSLLAVTSEASRVVMLVAFARGVVVDTIPTNQPASHMLALTADGRHLFTSNVAAGNVTEQDVAARTAVRGIAVAPGGETVWVGSNQARTVSVIDTRRGAVVDTIGGFGMPYRLAVTPDARTVVVTDPPRARVLLLDAATRRVRATIEVPNDGVVAGAEFAGSSSPEGIALSRDGRTAYVALQGASRVAAIDLASATIVATMATGASPDGIAYSPRVAGAAR